MKAVRMAIAGEIMKLLGIEDEVEAVKVVAMVDSLLDAVEKGDLILPVIVLKKGGKKTAIPILKQFPIEELERLKDAGEVKRGLENFLKRLEERKKVDWDNPLEYLSILGAIADGLKKGECEVVRKPFPERIKVDGVGLIFVGLGVCEVYQLDDLTDEEIRKTVFEILVSILNSFRKLIDQTDHLKQVLLTRVKSKLN